MREEHALRLMSAIERQRQATRRLVDGTIDEGSTQEFLAATEGEASALEELERAIGLTPRSSSRSRRS